MTLDMTVMTLGAHVLDVLALPVESVPDGQGAALLEQIKASAAGTAGGTALSLAKLGATAPPRRWSLVASAATTAISTSRPSTRSRPAPGYWMVDVPPASPVDRDPASRPPARRTVDGP